MQPFDTMTEAANRISGRPHHAIVCIGNGFGILNTKTLCLIGRFGVAYVTPEEVQALMPV